jgi:predicted outer membrane repeat protein
VNVFFPATGHDSLLSVAQKASAWAVAILLLIGAQTGSAQTTPPEANAYTTDSPEARATAKFLHGQDLEGKDGPLSKAGGELARLYQRQRAGLQKKKQKAIGEGLAATVSDNKVVIDAAASGSAKALMEDLEELGLRQAARSGRIVSGRLPISAIAEAADLSTLQFMRPSVTRSSVGDVTTQGNEATRVSEARISAEVDGTGMKVGVISDSYNQKVDPGVDDADDDIASGDLPPRSKIQILDDVPMRDPIDEGRAMMQIIRDVAPNVRLAFHAGLGGGRARLAEAIRDLAAVESEVIVDDLFIFTQPFFQDGEVAQVADSVATEGIPYFSAAGNAERQSYSSEFREVSTGNRTFHDFDSTSSVDIYQTVQLPVGESVTFSLQWTDPYFSAGGPGADADIDVFVTNDTLGIEESSTDPNVGLDPIEVLTFTNDGNTDADGDGQADTQFQIAIELSGGPPPDRVKYIYFSGALSIEEYDTRSPTSFGHPNAKNVAGVAAASYKDTPAFGTDSPQIEDFSSEGGVPIYFDKDGNALSSPVVRNKPDFTAPDDADNTFFGQDTDGDGFPNFTGTSAAAPHAAAIAALMLDKNPSLTPQEIYQKLAGSAIDMDDPATPGFDSGFDFRTGTGLIQADRALSAVQAQTRLYVDADATGKNTGASWPDAYTTLQDAFDEANLHPSREYETWVAEGTYRPDVDSIGHASSGPFDHSIGDRAESFTLTRDSVEVYGGFSGSESTRDQRDPSRNEVALSGDIGARSDTSDNSYHVVYLDGRSREPITGATVLDGLTIAEGNARGAFPNDSGGGVFCEGGGTGNDCQPALSNLLFRNNDAIFGGGLFINGSDTEFTTSTTGGTTTGRTGQATAKSQATGKASRPIYPESGDARRGAGGRSYSAPTPQRKSPGEVRVGSSTGLSPRDGSLESGSATTKATSGHQVLTLSGSEFRGNFAESSGGAVYNYGSGSTSSPVFQEVLFTENEASFGGAIYNDGRSSRDASPLLVGVDFASNRARQSGGAIYSAGRNSGSSSLFLTRSRLVLNEADFGGALYFDGSDGGSAQPVVVSSLLAGNVADTSGGAAYSLGLDGTVSPSYVNATMAGNEARFGGGLYNDGRSGTASVRARNTILWKNAAGSGPQAFNSASGATFGVSYSLVDGGTSGITESGGSSTTYDGSTNLEADPQFASGAGGDGQWGTGDDDLRLQGPGSSGGSSPAIDAGINDALDLDGDGTDEITKDVAGNDRLKEVSGASDSGSGSGPLVDMGAYESSGSPLPVELARLDARLEDGAVSVQWTTLSETENAGFAVQRKRQDGGWKQVGFVGGAGTTTQPQSYSLVDRDIPFEADSLSYRLRQVDTDGSGSFSDAVTVRRGAPSLKLLSTYPNPARQQATVRYAVPERQEITIRLHDVLGREVRTLVRSRKEGRQKLSLDVGGLSSGVYFLRLQSGGEMRTRKLTIVR